LRNPQNNVLRTIPLNIITVSSYDTVKAPAISSLASSAVQLSIVVGYLTAAGVFLVGSSTFHTNKFSKIIAYSRP
jgi:hypothetical protein